MLEAAQVRFPTEGYVQERRLGHKIVRQIQEVQRGDTLADQLMTDGGQGQVEALQHGSLVGHAQHGGVTVPGALIRNDLDLVDVLRRLLDQVVQADVPIYAAQEELLLVGTKSERADLGSHRYRGNGGALHLAGGQFIGTDLGTDVALARHLLLQGDDLAFTAPQEVHAEWVILRPAVGNRFQLQSAKENRD